MSQEIHSSEGHTGHPTAGLYFKIAMILSVVTAIEVGISILHGWETGLFPCYLCYQRENLLWLPCTTCI